MNNYNQLKEVLNDIFELNKADLDFGIYRIINQKRKQVNEFIEKQLPEDIKKALSETQSSDRTEIENELKELKKKIEALDEVAETHPKYIAKLEQLKSIENSDVLEQEVFSHLANFFRRYYKDGDFISMRRYKKDVYAIPYEGEEVKLHWANHDQYYIKSSENFKNYSFNTPDGKKVTFQLKEVSTEQNNNKTQGDAERRFAIYKDLPIEEIEGALFINFIYEPVAKSISQDNLKLEGYKIIIENLPHAFDKVTQRYLNSKGEGRKRKEKIDGKEKELDVDLLFYHIDSFVSKNSFDYFIHKDLGGFLTRELDFYIKNEVLYIDDINIKQSDFFVAQLSKVKAIKVVAGKVIDFLAQIENFQKKLWLKKKFVIRTDYCITLDKIPSIYYPEILANKEQIKEWSALFDVGINSIEQLVFEQFLLLDTKFFDEAFKDRLLSEFDNLEKQTNGLLINSENFQALNIFENKYTCIIDSVYIDPPYNSDSSPIIYKNDYKSSSWLSLMNDRLLNTKHIMKNNAFLSVAIDQAEVFNIGKYLDETFDNIGIVSVIHKPEGRNQEKFFATSNEFMLVYSIDKSVAKFTNILYDEEKKKEFNLEDEIGKYKLNNYLRSGGGDDNLRINKPHFFYPVYVNPKTHEVALIKNNVNDVEVLPITNSGQERTWKTKIETLEEQLRQGNILATIENDKFIINEKYRVDRGQLIKSHWIDKRYNAINNGTNLLADIIGEKLFSFPKSIYTVFDTINLTTNKESFVLDYFSGSGTTGHAVIKLNREDGGNRKFILVEMGTYFNTVTKPRIQKVIYSDNWKNGKPQDKNGISQIVKYQVLESYEDTLNNLVLNSQLDQAKLDFSDKANEEYMLQYMLEMESREHLFNLEMFRKPFDYQLNVTENNELKPTKVDLVETFNYLIGLYVNKVQRVKDIKVVEGVTRTGVKTLVIWRDIETTTHDDVEKLIRRFYDSQRTKEFDQIFINGDHHLENLRQEGDHFKVKMIEETFFKKMFNETEL